MIFIDHYSLFQNSFDTDEREPYINALRANETSYYLLKDLPQVLPCTSWTPGDPACWTEWMKLKPERSNLITYNLSTGGVESGPSFDLASDFGLVIKSVTDDHAGQYQCQVGDGGKGVTEVRVIGKDQPDDQH